MADEKAGELARVVPEVQTLARPVSGILLAARQEVHRNTALRAVFEAARTDAHTSEWLAGQITPELERVLDCAPEAVIHVAQYLADEYLQIGDAVLVIDRVTGRALARITDDDLWTPAAVPRDSGEMSHPLPRLRPDLEGFLVSYYFDRAKDVEMLARVRERYPSTLALRDEGESRLRAVTRAGRANMTDQLRESLPNILRAVQGSALTFLNHFEFADTPPEGLVEIPKTTAVARSQQSIADPLTFNFRHDRLMALSARIGTTWVRDIAVKVASTVQTRRPLSAMDLSREALEPGDFWVVPPGAYSMFMPFTAGLLPVEGTAPTGLVGQVGVIVVHPFEYAVQARELFSRWDVMASMAYTLYIDPAKVIGLTVSDIPVEVRAEII